MGVTQVAVATQAPPEADARARRTTPLVRWLALAVLIGNALIIVTGAAVRLTGSGLGCPTWPRCTDSSYTNTAALGIHGYIEFGNRLLTIVVALVVGAAIVAAILGRPRRRALVALALAQFGGFVAQAVVGGITVRTSLNPWSVSLHFGVSAALVYGAYALWVRSGEGDGPREYTGPAPLVWLGRGVAISAGAVLLVGTVVTGSGPHAGDDHATRTGLDPAQVAQLHADAVFLLVGLTIAAILAYAATGHRALRDAALVLLAAELAQGAIGFTQYFTGLPVLLVGLHVAGSAALWIAALRVLFLTRVRPTA
ncbi:MAG: heme synthase [Actinomycetia bacterium]|nr:heme synthase [Actinomycetes bacterium]